MFAAEERGDVPKGTAKRWAHETKSIKRLPEKKTAAPRKIKKKAEMVKWTAFVDELGRISDEFIGDSESSSKTQFPYSPAAGPASR